MRKLLKEPLFVFLLLGALLFTAYRWVMVHRTVQLDEIVVTAAHIENLAGNFKSTWQRPPTEAELKGLIKDYLREEALYREGLAMGVDRNDTVVRRRIRQKLEFVADAMSKQISPTDTQLQAYLAENAANFRVEAVYSFRQVYLNPDRHGEMLEVEARRLLAELRDDPATDARQLGDSIMLEHAYANVGESEVAKTFGAGFTESIGGLPVGTWSGPVPSGYGVHLVRVDESTPARDPALREVRARVAQEWLRTRQLEAREQFYEEVLKRYSIVIERPEWLDESIDLAETEM